MEKQFNLLIVDDDEDDKFLIRQAFEDDSNVYSLQLSNNDAEILENIRNPQSIPDLIILDLKVPKSEGLEILEYLRNSPLHKRIPIIILSRSSNPVDIEKAYQLGANSYIIKPNSYSKLMLMAEKIRQYWFGVSELPPRLWGL